MEVALALGLLVFLFVILGSGLWIGLSLLGVGLIAMEFVSSRPVGDAMVLTIWGSTSSWTLWIRAEKLVMMMDAMSSSGSFLAPSSVVQTSCPSRHVRSALGAAMLTMW